MGAAFRLSPALKAVAFFAEVVEKYSGEFSVFIALEMVIEHKIIEAEQRTFAETLSVRKLGGESEKSIRKLMCAVIEQLACTETSVIAARGVEYLEFQDLLED